MEEIKVSESDIKAECRELDFKICKIDSLSEPYRPEPELSNEPGMWYDVES